MKFSFKKAFSLLMAIVFCLTFAACGSSDTTSEFWTEEEIIIPGTSEEQTGNDAVDSTGSDEKNPSSQNQSSGGQSSGGALSWNQIKAQIPSTLKNSTVTMWCWNELSDRPGAKDVIEKFSKETGINVKFVRQNYYDYATKVTAAVASNQAPDIVRLEGYQMGLLNSLQPIQNIKFDFNDKAWDARVRDFYSFNGKTYAVNLKNTLYQQPYMLIYNKNLIGKYDLEDPYTLWKQGKWTISKFEEIIKTFSEEAGDDYTAWTSYQFIDVANWYGQSLIVRKGEQFANNSTNNKLIKGLQTYSNWREAGYITTVRFDRTNFENGKILFFTESPIGLRKSHYYFSELKKAGAVGAVPNPTVDGGLGRDTTIISEYEAYGFPKGAPNALGAAYFLRFFLDADNYDKNTFFTDKTVLDVYETLMNNSKVFKSSDYVLITEDNGSTGEVIATRLANAKANGVVTVLDQHMSVIDINVKAANAIIKNLGK